MSEAANDLQLPSCDGPWQERQPDKILKTDVTLYQGVSAGRDLADSGLVKPFAAGKAYAYYQPYGVAYEHLLGDGTKRPIIHAGRFERENATSGDEVLETLPLGWPLYGDSKMVYLTDGGGTRAYLGAFGGLTSEGQPMVWIGLPFRMGPIKWPVVFGFAEVAALGAVLTGTLNFGPPLPGPCRVLGYSNDELTVFSGGAIATATFKLGISTDDDAIHTALDIFTGATAAPKKGTAGVLGYNCAPLAKGAQIMGTVTTTTGNCSAATAGAFVGSILLQPGS